MTEFTPLNPDWEATTRRGQAAQGMMRTMGLEVTYLAPGEIHEEMPLDPRFAEGNGGLHGGAVLAVPHNVGSALSALRIGYNFDMLLVAKNSPGVTRTRIALDFYERMKVSVLMVRGGNTHALSRALFAALKHKKLVAATLDNLDRSGRSIGVRIFGQEVGLSGWAASIAVRMQVPVIPAWFHTEGCKQHVTIGEAIVAQDTRAATQHYARFFEQQILRDPASWAYLADKHWQALLQRAVQPGVD